MKRIYDIGDGKRNQWGTYAQAIDENFTELEEGKMNNTDVVQETGESTTQVMSQAAVTKELTELGNNVGIISNSSYKKENLIIKESKEYSFNKNGNIDRVLGGTSVCYNIIGKSKIHIKGWYENSIESIPYIITKQISYNDTERILADILEVGGRIFKKEIDIPEGYNYIWVGNPTNSNIYIVESCLGESDKIIYPFYKYLEFTGNGINGNDGTENAATEYRRYDIILSDFKERNAAAIVFQTKNHSSLYKLGWAFYDNEQSYIDGDYLTEYGVAKWVLAEIPNNAEKFSATLGKNDKLLGVYFIDANLYSLIKNNEIKIGNLQNELTDIKNLLPISYDKITNEEISYQDGYYNATANLVPRSDGVWKGFKQDITGYDGGTLTIKGCCPSKFSAQNGFVLKDGSIQTFGIVEEIEIPTNVQYAFASFQLNAEAQDGYSVNFLSKNGTIAEIASKEYVKEELANIPQIEVTNNLKGKTWQVLGDSISTVGSYVAIGEHYYNLIAQKYGMNFSNENVNANPGRTIAYNINEGVNGSFVEKVSELTEAKDITTILGGTNDYIFNTPIGEFNLDEYGKVIIPNQPTDCTTFYDALVYLYNYILTNFPTTKLIHILPLQRGRYSDSMKNSAGHTMHDYWTAIETVANYFSIGIIPLGRECSMNPRIEAQRLIYFKSETNSGEITHPNKIGQVRMSEYIGATMNAMV